MPAHLMEVSRRSARATFPGADYQIGNFIASSNALLQTWLAARAGGDYRVALASVVLAAAVSIAMLSWLGREAGSLEAPLS